MIAGQLTERIYILEEHVTENETGNDQFTYIENQTIKARKRKLSASVGKGVNASEEFIANTLVLEVRKYSFLNEKMRVRYGDKTYKVILFDEQPGNSIILTLSKING